LFPVLNPEYIGIHAACCRVANLSGANSHLDELVDSLGDVFPLYEDEDDIFYPSSYGEDVSVDEFLSALQQKVNAFYD